MRVAIPSFYKNFKCTADKCTDSCCIGWEIDIDPDTYEYYKSAGGEFGERLKREIENGAEPHFKLNGERCAFLNEQNLCDIYINCGEEHLCEICTEHPRFHEWFGDYKESGLGLCCEEACRLLFENDLPLRFETIETDEAPDDREFDEELFSLIYNFRKEAFEILQTGPFPIQTRLNMIIHYAEQIQDYIDFGIEPEINLDALYKRAKEETVFDKEYLTNLFSLLKKLEPISPEYTEHIKKLENELPRNLDKYGYCRFILEEKYNKYEIIAVYTIYRHLMKAVFDGEVLKRVKFAETFVAAVFLFDCYTLLTTGDFTMKDRINNVKMLSKEVEYCEENLELLFRS